MPRFGNERLVNVVMLEESPECTERSRGKPAAMECFTAPSIINRWLEHDRQGTDKQRRDLKIAQVAIGAMHRWTGLIT